LSPQLYNDDALIGAVETAMKRIARVDRGVEIAEAAKLSPHEREVLDALALRHSNKVIACDLGISQHTVDVHRARMMVRLAVRQFAEAIRLAALAGLGGGE
jgi:two-component system, LuxR family, response regulator FixJ